MQAVWRRESAVASWTTSRRCKRRQQRHDRRSRSLVCRCRLQSLDPRTPHKMRWRPPPRTAPLHRGQPLRRNRGTQSGSSAARSSARPRLRPPLPVSGPPPLAATRLPPAVTQPTSAASLTPSAVPPASTHPCSSTSSAATSANPAPPCRGRASPEARHPMDACRAPSRPPSRQLSSRRRPSPATTARRRRPGTTWTARAITRASP